MDTNWGVFLLIICIILIIAFSYNPEIRENFVSISPSSVTQLFSRFRIQKIVRIVGTSNGFFKHTGCTMLTLEDFAEGRLASAPFLSLDVSATSFPEVVTRAKNYIERVARGDIQSVLNESKRNTTAPSQGLADRFIYDSKSSSNSNSNGMYPFDYQKDRQIRIDKLDSSLQEHFVNLPEQQKSIAQSFEFYGPVYLLAANHPKSNPPLQPPNPPAPNPDPVIPPIEKDENSPAEPKKEPEPPPPPTADELDTGQPFVYAMLYFPSMTKDGRPSPNYDFLGRCHRWMFRLLNSRQYKSYHKQCRNSCYGTTMIRKQGPFHPIYNIIFEYFTPCGLHRRVPDPIPSKRTGKYEYFFTAYELNTEESSVKSLLSSNSPAKLTSNILSTNAEWAAHCMNILISENNKYFLALRPNSFGVYLNVRNEDITGLCRMRRLPKYAQLVSGIPLKGFNASRMEITENYLFIHGNRIIYHPIIKTRPIGLDSTEEIIYQIKIAEKETEGPIALVLEDSGKVNIYDRYNQLVSSSNFIDLMNKGNTESELNGIPFSEGIYDPNQEYRIRIEQLKSYLRLRNLLKEEEVQQICDIEIILDNMSPVSEFNSEIDYIDRLYRLVSYMQALGIKVPSYLIPSLETDIPIEMPQDMIPVAHLSEYDEKQEFMNRILTLSKTMGIDSSIYFTQPASVTNSSAVSSMNVSAASVSSSSKAMNQSEEPFDLAAYEAAQNPYLVQ